MTTAAPIPTAQGPMDLMRRTAFLGGALYVLTFLSSIPATLLLSPLLNDPEYVLGPGPDTQVVFAASLEIVNALACIGTAVVLYPVVKRQNETLALGFVTSRVLEAAILFTGVVSVLAVVTLRQDVASTPGADADSLVTVAAGLVAVRDWTLLLGPGLAIANALLLGTLMYRSRLVPRAIPLMGLVGAPLLLAANVLTMFGYNEQFSLLSLIALPGIFFWELSLGVYLVVKGFKPAPILTTTTDPAHDDVPAAAGQAVPAGVSR
jgi:hypothetical protein